MELATIIGSIQIALAALQLKYDHFKKPSNRPQRNELDNFNNLGDAIRTLEYALSETVAFVGTTDNLEPNPRLASLWEQASQKIRNIQNSANLTDLTFEKGMYWSNPNYFMRQNETNLHRISLDNMLVELRQLRSKYDQLQRKIYE